MKKFTTGVLAVALAMVAIIAFTTVMTVSAQSNTTDWRQSVTGLTVSAGDDPGEMLITWDAHTQTTKTLRDYRVAWTPQGESFKSANRTNWNVYTTSTQHTVTGLDAGATYQVKVRTRYEGNQGSRWTEVVTGQTAAPLAAPTNSPATGQPTITGRVEVGKTLTANTSGISDDNGLTNVAFSHQWVRNADGADTDISGATASTYVITTADAGSAIKVGVSFTDDEGYSETSTSSATASVPEPAPQTPPPPVIVPPKEPEFARASHQIWSASLTVRSSSGVLGCSNGVANNFCSVHLTDDDFTHDSTDYVIDLIFLRSNGNLEIDFDTDLATATQGLTLNVDGTAFAFEDADFKSAQFRRWNNSGLSWTTGNIVSLTLTPAAIAPDAPTGLTANAAGETEIKLSWTAPTGTITGYKVEVSANGDTGWSNVVADTASTDTTYSHTGLSAGNTRHYRVSAINTDGTGDASNVGGATTAAANVLVSNTGRNVDAAAIVGIGDQDKTHSHGFDTGPNPGGYNLASVGVYVVDEALTSGETFTAHIYTDNGSGVMDTLAYTLTSPASYTHRAVNTFTAPVGATLDTSTDYLVVFEGTGDSAADFILGVTASNGQDRGTRTGWGIENAYRFNGISTSTGNSYQVSVNGSAIGTSVSASWSLIPTGLSVGDEFRLLFLSSTGRDAEASGIGTYNTFIQDLANAGHTDIQQYGDGFKVVGCTRSAEAPGNTRTIYTTSDKGVPIYWLNGAKAADDYEDFYDGSWDEEANDKNESGTDGPDTSQSANRPWTGCDNDGTRILGGLIDDDYLGDSFSVRVGRPNASGSGNGPLSGDTSYSPANTRPMYGLSEIFQVADASSDATLSALAVNDGTNDLTLTPTFASGTYAYAATVDNEVDEVTLTATVNEAGATVSGVTLAGTAIADSDFTDGITVPSLVVGDNEVVVTVTAEDASTQTYTVTVTRVDASSDATGKPGITGAAQVGMTLTAGTADIVDADGLTTPGYTYQWLQEGSDISGQTSSTYTPTSSDIGKNIKVKVEFTDDDNNAESLTSDETTAVVPAAITCPTDTTWCSILTTGYQTPNSDDEFLLGLGTTVGTPSESFGSLDDATFTHLGLSYTVTQILVDSVGGSSLFATSPNLPDDGAGLTLSVQQVSGQRDIPLAGNAYQTVPYLPATTKTWQFVHALNSSVADPLTTPLLHGPDRNYDPYHHHTNKDTEVTIWLTFANRTAAGAPAIRGTAQVGETLTAGIGDIADVDGLPTTFPGDYTFQWLRVDADGVSNQTLIGTDATTYTPVAADTGKKIKVQVTFTDGGGTAETLTSAAYPSSGTIMTPPPPTTPPGKVFGVNITASDQTLQVNWTQVSGATGYKVQWKSGGESYSSSRQATVSSGSTTSRTISNLQNGTEYTIRVIATKTGVSDGTPSDDANATPTASTTVPTAPRDLNATAVGNNRINLSWNAPDSDGGSLITGYKIEVSNNGRTNWTTRVANTGSTNRTHSHTGLSTGDTRHYRVSAINSSGTGPHSNVDSATIGLPTVSIANATTTEGGDIVFTITISPTIDGFHRIGYGTGIEDLPPGSRGARKDDDYIAHHPAGNIIQIGYGLASVELIFTTVDDELVEGTEIFEIGLYPSEDEGRYFSYGKRTAIATIRDDENGGQAYQDSVRGDTSTNHSISPGGSVQNRIETVNDADWYRTSLTKDHCYQIKVEGSSADETLTLQYPALRGVYRSDGTLITGTNENAGGLGTTAISNVKLDTTATYYIAAGLYRFENGGTFRMSLTDLGTTDTSCGAAKAGAIAATLQISVADASKREWPNPQAYLVFDVTLDRDADEEVRVDYTTEDGTAVAGQDYESQSGTLVFGIGVDSKRIWVPIQFDREDEETETMTLLLSNARGAEISTPRATGFIEDYSSRR